MPMKLYLGGNTIIKGNLSMNIHNIHIMSDDLNRLVSNGTLRAVLQAIEDGRDVRIPSGTPNKDAVVHFDEKTPSGTATRDSIVDVYLDTSESRKHECSMQKKKESLSKVTESIDGVTYTITGVYVEVHEDSYTDGEGKYVDAYNRADLVGARYDSLEKLVRSLADKAIYDDDYRKPENWMAFEYDATTGTLRLDTDVLVDVDNDTATPAEIELWKKGEKTLYNAHYNVYVRCEYTAVVPKDAIERETEDLGFDTSYLE